MLFSKPNIDLCVVGLGNPGKKYERTRHNVGFVLVDDIARELGVSVSRLKHQGTCGQGLVDGKKVLFVKPQTFMNRSGLCVHEVASYYRLPPERVLVICDDVSLDVGKMRIRRKGSHGGHNGLRDIALSLDSENYPRIKIGVGKKPHPDYDLADWVLGALSPKEWETVRALAGPCLDTLRLLLEDNLNEAMNRYN